VPLRIVMPSMGMYTEEGVLTAWLRPAGARVEIGEAIVEITTEKVTFEVPSPAAGILHHVAEPGANLSVEALMGYVLADGETLASVSEPAVAQVDQLDDRPRKSPAADESSRSGGSLRASPAAKRLATQHGVDLHLVKGSGPGGRIVEVDVLAKVSPQRK
jgi:pyruvate/2-oxoglutarate dehydrogenase complex dihydrolipoamide acyltransferase (E2) component